MRSTASLELTGGEEGGGFGGGGEGDGGVGGGGACGCKGGTGGIGGGVCGGEGGPGGAGGPGIVIIRGPSVLTFAGGPCAATTFSTHPGGDKIAKFTASGTLTISK